MAATVSRYDEGCEKQKLIDLSEIADKQKYIGLAIKNIQMRNVRNADINKLMIPIYKYIKY
jgi:hypothetical protein